MITEEGWTYLAQRLHLSPREVQIARGVMEDRTEHGIARELGISPHTVHTHLERVYRKLEVGSRVQLSVLLMRRFMELSADPGTPLPPICDRHARGECPYDE